MLFVVVVVVVICLILLLFNIIVIIAEKKRKKNDGEIKMKHSFSYINQSTAHRRATSSKGRLTACSTINMVTRPADGIAAAPTAAATAVNLTKKNEV